MLQASAAAHESHLSCLTQLALEESSSMPTFSCLGGLQRSKLLALSDAPAVGAGGTRCALKPSALKMKPLQEVLTCLILPALT